MKRKTQGGLGRPHDSWREATSRHSSSPGSWPRLLEDFFFLEEEERRLFLLFRFSEVDRLRLRRLLLFLRPSSESESVEEVGG